jgi:hypothetical protein
MDLDTFRQLLMPAGQTVLAQATALAPTEQAQLRCLTQLRKGHAACLARAALETVLLRQRARAKFSRADSMYFTREALEQASGEVVAAHRARRFAGYAAVGDFGCGIGGDLLALAGNGRVDAVDLDPLRLAMARGNLAAHGLAEQVTFHLRDLRHAPLPSVQAIFFDPARRAEGRRQLSVRHYQPPLEIVHDWLAKMPAVGVKIAPGVDLAEVAGYDAEVEFISAAGELKECVLWFGPLRTAARRATLLPAGQSLTAERVPAPALGEPLAYLYEPDPAILRAGLVTTLADRLGARQLDPDIAYLTTETAQATPFARLYQIEAAFPFHLKNLRDWLRVRHVGQVIVKRRGSAVDPVMLEKQLKLSGAQTRVLFLIRAKGRPFVLIGEGSYNSKEPRD